MPEFPKFHIKSYEKAILMLLEERLIDAFRIDSAILRNLIRQQMTGHVRFSIPELIYGVDSLIALCDLSKNNLIEINNWLKKQWEVEPPDES